MRKTVQRAAVFSLAASLTLAGCSGHLPTLPSNDDATTFFTRAPAPGFDVLHRNNALETDLAVTRVIGAEGGSLEIPEAGITFVIPPEALGEDTEITMRALAGTATAVEFAPHGLVFQVPATMRVRARGTRAEALVREQPDRTTLDRLLGVYFEGDPDAGVDPLETIPTFLVDGHIVFEVVHFSGYATASG